MNLTSEEMEYLIIENQDFELHYEFMMPDMNFHTHRRMGFAMGEYKLVM